ncbi:aldehyde dehydrogenase family protein [Sphingoaurantiacus capsulatus]|uniref:aldehyde dehydrogenase (NAD(+)) n=1 Tax=Sphingoaurantiacus capsulatus TaxID=1771310 RepID=A0ABV7XA19_9SPHN
MAVADIFARLGLTLPDSGGNLVTRSPIDGAVLVRLTAHDDATIDATITAAAAAFPAWRDTPAPRRGELVRLFGNELRAHKAALAELVTLEAGKVTSEAAGEVQEMIDIADFAVGLSRQLHGLTIASERPGHHMRESWQPLGPVGIISAFNFPVAVWAWNAALALVCGDPVVWKPSEKTPLCAIATLGLLDRAIARFDGAPKGLSGLILGAAPAGERLVSDVRVPLVSATGSTAMGRKVGAKLAERFGRALLELGGNNAAIVAPSADFELARRAILFAATGTAGQRCTSLRRAFIHTSRYDEVVGSLKAAYASLPVGDPREAGTLVGPLIDGGAYEAMQAALAAAREQGGIVHGGERVGEGGAFYVRPALVEMPEQAGVMLRETFAPILYVTRYSDLGEAIALQNAAAHGLSSCIFTTDLRESERFVSAAGSDCGIANVNIGPSGAEIGGAFGGEKETGGGRESGSDSWRAYMRRQTSTVNYSNELPLAQGVKFDV